MNARKIFRSAGLVALAAFAMTACDDDDQMMAPEQPGTILEIAAEAGNFTTLEAAIEAADLTATLEGPGPFTVFAPTDAAFGALPEGTLEELLLPANQAVLADILTYHVTAGEFDASMVIDAGTLEMLNGLDLDITLDGATVLIGDAVITTTDIDASNGRIHVIDAVLLPPTTIAGIVAGSEDFETLEAALEAAELTATLDGAGPFTVFAPTDEAFDALPEGTLEMLLMPENMDQLVDILTYHVVGAELDAEDVVAATTISMLNGETTAISVDGSAVMINDAVITATDVEARNGVVHIIDTVLIPAE